MLELFMKTMIFSYNDGQDPVFLFWLSNLFFHGIRILGCFQKLSISKSIYTCKFGCNCRKTENNFQTGVFMFYVDYVIILSFQQNVLHHCDRLLNLNEILKIITSQDVNGYSKKLEVDPCSQFLFKCLSMAPNRIFKMISGYKRILRRIIQSDHLASILAIRCIYNLIFTVFY